MLILFQIRIKKLSLEAFRGGFLPIILSATLSQIVLSKHGATIFDFGTGNLSLNWFLPLSNLFTFSNFLNYVNIQFLIANISILAIMLIIYFRASDLKKDKYFVFSLWAIIFLQIYAFTWNTGLSSIKLDLVNILICLFI